MRGLVAAGLLACGFLVAGPGEAAAQNAQIIGMVKDDSGGVIPGVTVTAKNQDTGLVRAVVTDAQGNYRATALPPGTYTVTIEMQGFASETRADNLLVIDQTATINFTLKLATVSEEVSVKADSPVVDVTVSSVSTSVSNDQMELLPVNSRRWVDLAMLTPGTSQDGIRGQFYRGNVNVGAGGAEYQNAFVVDGVNNTWAQMGEPRQNFAMDAIREFKVSTSNFKAEYGLATGGLVTVVTKSGTNDLSGSALLFFRDESMTAREYFQTEVPEYYRYQYGGTIGGPIVRDKTHYFLAYEGTNEVPNLTANARGLWPQYEGTFPSKQDRWTYTGKVNHLMNNAHSLLLRVAQEYEYRPINTVGGRTTPSASQDFSVPRDSVVAGHTWIANPRIINEAKFQYSFSKYQVAPPYSEGSWDAGDFSQARLGLCQPVYSYPSIIVGGCGNSQMGPETRWEVKNDFSYYKPDWAGDHQFKAGGDFNVISFEADSIGSPLGSWTFPKDQEYDVNDRTTWPTSYNNSLPSYRSLPIKIFSAYIQDDWRVKNLTFNLGLRYDVSFGSYNENLYEQMEAIAEKFNDPYYATFPIEVPLIDVTKRGDHNNFGPRAGVAWDLDGSGTTNIHAAYGMFYDNVRTLQNSGEMTWMQSRSITISNPPFPDPLGGRTRESYISTAPPNITVFDNELVAPYAHQYSVGIARMLTKEIALTVDGTFVNRYSERDSTDINLPDQVTRVKPYPWIGRLSYTQSLADSTYRALLVKVEKRLSRNYQFLASYTLAQAKSVGMSNSDSSFYGYKPLEDYSGSDRMHRLVVSGIYQLPYQMQVSMIGDFRSPLRFGLSSNLGDLNNDGYTGDFPAGLWGQQGCRNLDLAALNTFRATRGLAAVTEDGISCQWFKNVDIRFAKQFNLASQQIEFIAQLFNIANYANFNTPTGAITSAAFGTTTALVPYINAPSRQAEFAVRWRF